MGMGMGIWQCFGFRHHSGLCTMPKLSYLGSIILVSICFRMMLIQIITRVYNILSPWHIYPILVIWLVLQVWYPCRDSLIPLYMMLIIDTMHSFIILSNIGSHSSMDHIPQRMPGFLALSDLKDCVLYDGQVHQDNVQDHRHHLPYTLEWAKNCGLHEDLREQKLDFVSGKTSSKVD